MFCPAPQMYPTRQSITPLHASWDCSVNSNIRVMPPRPSSIFLASKRVSSTVATKSTSIPFSLRAMSTTNPSETAQAQASADASAPSFSSIGIKRTNIETAPGVNLSEQQKVLVGSVLDVRHHHTFAPIRILLNHPANIINSCSRATRPSSTSAYGTRMQHSQTTSPSQPATPSSRLSSTASQPCSSRSSCSHTASSPRAIPSSWK